MHVLLKEWYQHVMEQQLRKYIVDWNQRHLSNSLCNVCFRVFPISCTWERLLGVSVGLFCSVFIVCLFVSVYFLLLLLLLLFLFPFLIFFYFCAFFVMLFLFCLCAYIFAYLLPVNFVLNFDIFCFCFILLWKFIFIQRYKDRVLE